MARYGKDIYRGSIVWLKCMGGEICGVYQLAGTPGPPLVINLALEDPDIPPLPAHILEQVKRDQGLDFSGSAFGQLMGDNVPKTRVVAKRVFTRGHTLGMRVWIEGRIVWVDEPI